MIKVISCKLTKGEWIANVESHNLYIDGKGGQNGDKGIIGDINFIKVIDENNLVVEKEILPGEYSFKIDKGVVEDIAIQHTAQHLFSAIAYNDYSLNTVSFRMTDTYTTVDLDRNDFDDELISTLEAKINKAIKSGSEVKIKVVTRDEANNIDTFRKKISDKVVGDVRVVDIENFDTSACAGYHVENISNIRLFKIINFEKIKGSYMRIYFLAGERAIDDYILKNNVTRELNKKFSCRDYEILDMVEKFSVEKKNLETTLSDIIYSYSQFLAKDLQEKALLKNNIKYIIFNGQQELINSLLKQIDDSYTFIGIWETGGVITSNDIKCNEFIKKLSATFEIKGGGKDNKANFKGSITIQDIINSL